MTYVVKSREGGETAKIMKINAVKQFVFWGTNGKYEQSQEYADSPVRNLELAKKQPLNV